MSADNSSTARAMEYRAKMRIDFRPPSLDDRAVILNLWTYFGYELFPFAETGGLRMNRFGVVGDDDSPTHHESARGQEIWWTKPAILLPMLITVNDEPAGFVNVARPPHAHPSVDYRIEDFFIINQWRRAGVGREALGIIVQRYPGRWEVGWLPMNKPAEQFWRAVTTRWNGTDWPVEQAPGTPSLPGLAFSV
jgi:predicted acetyltransferase